MANLEDYKTLASSSEVKIIEKKSDFIAAAARVATEEAAVAFLNQRKILHRTANHNVYAYVLRENARTRYSDDGEPTKTAGMPVLSVLNHAKLFNCIVVVTRYFGGTLLGTGGLVRAYTMAAQAAIENAGILLVESTVRITCVIEYTFYEQVCRLMEEENARVEAPEFAKNVHISAIIKAGTEKVLVERLNELCRGGAQIKISEAFYGTE